MSTFENFKRNLVPDPRLVLFSVEIDNGSLRGVADEAFAPAIGRFAEEHGLDTAVQFPRPAERQLITSRSLLRAEPTEQALAVSEVIHGETLKAYDEQNGFIRVARSEDDYLGWLPAQAVSERVGRPGHYFKDPRGYLYIEPSVSAAPCLELSYGVGLMRLSELEKELGNWCEVLAAGGLRGFLPAAQLAQRETEPPTSSDQAIVRLAMRFRDSPYLWGGRSAWGLDCSGLVQTVYAAFGINLPRDADQQQRSSGMSIDTATMKAADLLFFPEHVAIATGRNRFIHANAKYMRVSVNDFDSSDYGAWLRSRLTDVVRVNGVLDPLGGPAAL